MDTITQVYRALSTAADRIGANNYRLQRASFSGRKFRFHVTPEHREIVEAMPKLLSGAMSPDEAMALLWQYDTMKQRIN